jgi:hypothetical protein
MIAVDTNVLLHAHRRDSTWHAAARAGVSMLAESGQPWAIPWPCVHEFVAIATHPKVFDPPSGVDEALEQVAAWAESPRLTLLAEVEGYLPILATTLRGARVVGARVHDARIAALCLLHGVNELWTADRDFSRFPSLATRNPLVAG